MATSPAQPTDQSLAGYGYVVMAGILWGVQGPISKYCQAQGVPLLEIAFWRASLGGLCFLLHAARRRALAIPARHAACFVMFGFYAVGLQFAMIQGAIRESGAALSAVLLYTAPMWVAVFSRLIFGEKLTRAKITALALAMGGITLICLSGGSLAGQAASALGIGLGLATGLGYASLFIFYTWWKNRYTTGTICAYMFLGGGLVLLPFLDISLAKDWQTWAALVSLGVLTSYGAYFVYGQSLRLLSPVKVAVLCNLEPVVGTFLAWLWWHENFPPVGWLGCIVVLAAIVLLAASKD